MVITLGSTQVSTVITGKRDKSVKLNDERADGLVPQIALASSIVGPVLHDITAVV